MLFVSKITEIARLGIASSYVKNDEPVSIVFLGDPEIGKSTIILRFNPPKNTVVFSDLTKSKLEEYLKNYQQIKYIMIPDFIKVISRGKSTKANIISMLNAGIEEGILDITQYFGGSVTQTTVPRKPIRFGMMTAMTRRVMSDRRREWFKMGFFSRLLPVSFSYSKEQSKKIREYICAGRDIFTEKEKLRFRQRSILCNKRHVLHFEKFIENYAEAQKLYGFRMTKQFRSLLKASALLRSSDAVGRIDVRRIEGLVQWMNLDYNKAE